jgi:hypothetical protein
MEADMIWDDEERLSARVGLKPEWEPFEVAAIVYASAPGGAEIVYICSSRGHRRAKDGFVISKTWPSRIGEVESPGVRVDACGVKCQ